MSYCSKDQELALIEGASPAYSLKGSRGHGSVNRLEVLDHGRNDRVRQKVLVHGQKVLPVLQRTPLRHPELAFPDQSVSDRGSRLDTGGSRRTRHF